MDLNWLCGPDVSHLHKKLILRPLLKLKRQRYNEIWFTALLRLWYSKCAQRATFGVPQTHFPIYVFYAEIETRISNLCFLCRNLNSYFKCKFFVPKFKLVFQM